ncbi:hypothetical protein ACHAXR_005125 [Thalassiosira sp. AJA248-18]
MHSQQRQQQHNGGPPTTPTTLVPTTRLSDILPPSTAVSLLGQSTTRSILRNFLRCGCSPQPIAPSSSSSSNTNNHTSTTIGGVVSGVGGRGGKKSIRYRHPLDPIESAEEKEEIDLLLFGLSYDFSNSTNTTNANNNKDELLDEKKHGGNKLVDEQTKQRVAKAWSKLGFIPVPGYELDLTADYLNFDPNDGNNNNGGGNRGSSSSSIVSGTPVGGGINTHSLPVECPPSPKRGRSSSHVDSKHHSPNIKHSHHSHHHHHPNPPTFSIEQIFTQQLQTYQSIYGLDKSSFLTKGILFPPTTVPDRGPNGHMALMDCVFNALSSSPSEEGVGRLMDGSVGAAAALTARYGASSSSSSGGGGGGGGGIGEESNKEGDSVNNNERRSRYFSALSYQAIQTQQDDGPPLPNKPGATATSSSPTHTRPDLGVWDCRVLNGNNNNNNAAVSSAAMLLKRVVMNKKNPSGEDNTSSSSSGGEEKKGEESAEAAAAAAVDNNRSITPIVMAVDFSDPSEVQPVVEQMRSVILNVYDADAKDKVSSSANVSNLQACTTTMKALRKSTFGKTLIQEEVTVKGGGSVSSSEQRVALILAIIVPSNIHSTKASSSAAEEYKERQSRALLLYHLHKFALEVNCTLCFVSEKGTPAGDIISGGEVEEEGAKAAALADNNDPLLGRNSIMSIEELGKVIRRVAMGLSPVEQSDIEMEQPNVEGKDEGKHESKMEENGNTTTQRPPSIHVPGSHDAELIHGAYLRNASCEGRWDASKDDLSVALPPPHSTTNNAKKNETSEEKSSSSSSSSSGDEEWLSQLASSIGLSPDAAAAASTSSGGDALSPGPAERRERMKKEKSQVKKRPTRSTITRNKDSKPKDEKEVMNFFDNLLKK